MMRTFRNYILRLVILIPLIGIMVGCIYIPTCDHTLLLGTKKDFRKWAAQNQNASTVKLAGISRSNIESMFGKPAFVSQNSQCVAYVMGSENGIVIVPAFFGAGFLYGQTHVLKLVYDDRGRLSNVVPLSAYRQPPLYFFLHEFLNDNPDPMLRGKHLLVESNQACPPDQVLEVPESAIQTADPLR